MSAGRNLLAPETRAAAAPIARRAELASENLHAQCEPLLPPFATTSELEDLPVILGQSRAVDAVQFGIDIRCPGYNLYVMGPSGLGKRAIVQNLLNKKAATETAASDWCYVHNFDRAQEPRALELPPGLGRRFSNDMNRLVEDLRATLQAAFETDQYRTQIHAIEATFGQEQEKAIAEYRAKAEQQGMTLLQTPQGFVVAPLIKGKPISPVAFKKLPPKKREVLEAKMSEFQADLQQLLYQVPKWRQRVQTGIRELNSAVVHAAVNSLMDELKKQYAGLPQVEQYLARVQNYVIQHGEDFHKTESEERTPMLVTSQPDPVADSLRQYRVNVLIDHADAKGSPILYEDNPTYENLVGRIDYVSHMATLVTDFTLIRPGALHKANGGYLILDAAKILAQPFAWEALKRSLRSRQIRIESLGQLLSLVSTNPLEPEPIPLDVKVVLVGSRELYYLLYQFDPEFAELFKVPADFDDDMDRSPENLLLYARLLATAVRKERLQPFDRKAIAQVMEQAMRLAGDAEKLSLQIRDLTDLLREANHWANADKHACVTAHHVQRAIETQEKRCDRIRGQLKEQIQQGTLLIDTAGTEIGQVNGLSVLRLGGFSFAHPTRITARVRLGEGKVVDIEREVELSGPIHSKGVLILSGFLAGRYIPDKPLSLSASVVFEQSYQGVEGDSASSAELYALLSALAEIPIHQDLAVTGSVNQQGVVQAIGCVNEKIEGFFDICNERGLTGQQGVLIPVSNVRHLMLHARVVDAVAAGQFHIYPVETIDQGIELLTGIPAGVRDKDGKFPSQSINAKVESRLIEFAEASFAFHSNGHHNSV